MATPTLVQVTTSASTTTAPTISSFESWLPHPSLAGNCLIVFVAADNTNLTGNYVVTDDKGNTWTTGPTLVSGGGRHSCFYALNAAAGTRHISIAFTGGSAAYASMSLSEWYNIATSAAGDGTSSANSTTPVSTGAIVTTAADDLVLQCAYDVTGAFKQEGATGQVAKGTNFTWVSTNFDVGFFIQYTVKTAAGSITPSFTVTGAANFHAFNTLSLALKSATAGTAPPVGDMRIVHIQHMVYSINTTTPFTVPRFPCTGNLLVASIVHTNPDFLVGVADGNGNTWTIVPVTVDRPQSGNIRQAYAKNATTSPDMLGPTFTLNGTTTGDLTIVLYDIANADTITPYEAAIGGQGLQANPGGPLTTITITPPTSSGIILVTMGINAHAINGLISPSDGTLDSFWGIGIDGGGSTLNEDNGWCHYPYTAGGPVTFVWDSTADEVSEGVQDWSALAVAYDRLTPPPVVATMAKFPKPQMRNVFRR